MKWNRSSEWKSFWDGGVDSCGREEENCEGIFQFLDKAAVKT